MSSCDMFKMDNYDGPNASLHGGMKDEVTGELVETDIQNGSRLQLQELGYPVGALTRVVKQNGEYRDDMMFAGKYSVNFNACNFYPFIVSEIEVKKGDNSRDFTVKPYIRVKNVNIRKEGDKIVATFNLQAGDPEVRLNNIQLFMHTDMYVGDQVTSYPLNPTNGSFTRNFSAVVIDESVTHELSIDLTNPTNKSYFKFQRNYYFRVGAMANVPTRTDGTTVGTIRRNYAPYTIINFSVPQ